MAQVVGYHDNKVTFIEGPFVIVCPNPPGYRIEVQVGDSGCPCLPDSSIYTLLRSWDTPSLMSKEQAVEVCDKLNAMVKTGKLVKQGDGWWEYA